MELANVVKERYSLRKYAEKAIEEETKAKKAEDERKAKLREQRVKETAVQGDLFGF